MAIMDNVAVVTHMTSISRNDRKLSDGNRRMNIFCKMLLAFILHHVQVSIILTVTESTQSYSE